MVGTATTAGHLLAGLFIMLFATIFFTYDGRGIWRWVVSPVPRAGARPGARQRRARLGGPHGVRPGTVVIAATDALGIAIVALVLGLPSVVPLAVLVFLGAFIPVVGAAVSGIAAVAVALVAVGPVTALIMLGGVIAVQQLEGHVLQPFLMGRLVRVHPLAVVVVIAIGGLVAGIFGALIAVPLTAIVNAVASYLAGERRQRLEHEAGAAADPAVTRDTAHRAGFVAFVGRPNAGKSTLTNALVGEKVVITSSKPQTTRQVVRGIVHRPDAQLVLLDTPGLHRPRTLLGERLNDEVRAAWTEVDVVGFCLPGRREGRARRPVHRPRAGASSQGAQGRGGHQDRPGRPATGGRAAAGGRRSSARRGLRVGRGRAGVGRRGRAGRPAADLLAHWCRSRRRSIPDGELTDEPEQVLVAELIREAALEGVRDELPHSIAVVVEEMLPREDRPADRPLLDVHAFLYVERDSQKAIVIGPKGARLRDIGTGPRAADRGAARHAGLPRPARHGRQGLAARPATAAQARLLSPSHRSAGVTARAGSGPGVRAGGEP